MQSPAYQKLKDTRKLPSPTGIALKIVRLCGDDNTTIDDLAAVVRRDPATSARLLKFVNSPLAGLSRQVSSISEAVVLLGMQTVKIVAMGFSLLSQNRSGACKGFDYEGFWSDSLARAVAARHIAARLTTIAPDEGFTCALLWQIGRLAFATAVPETYAYVLDQVPADDPKQLNEAERAAFELDHDELAAELMADWRLPDYFSEAVRLQSPAVSMPQAGARAERLGQILRFVGLAAPLFVRHTVPRHSLASLTNYANEIGIAPDALDEIFELIGAEWQQMGDLFNISTRRVPPLAEIYAQAHP